MNQPTYGLPDSIRLIDDMHMGYPHIVGTYVLLGDQPAIVDPGPSATLPALEAGLAACGLTVADLHTILLTHIHLDHAGATGTLVARNPNLRVYVHQRGAPHMVAPEKLIRSATRLYGDLMDVLWGEFLPVPESHMTILSGGETLRIGDRELQVLDAPGHASHHVVYYEAASGAAFVGDTGGLLQPGLTRPRPATPPPDIDLEGWRRTLDALLALKPEMLLLTHFGPTFDPQRHINDQWDVTLRWAETVRESLERGEDEESAVARLRALADSDLGHDASASEREQFNRAGPVALSWQGLARYWKKRAEQA